jgi:hypothetical protein
MSFVWHVSTYILAYFPAATRGVSSSCISQTKPLQLYLLLFIIALHNTLVCIFPHAISIFFGAVAFAYLLSVLYTYTHLVSDNHLVRLRTQSKFIYFAGCLKKDMKDPCTHSSPRVRYKPSSHLRGENCASLCSTLYSWSLNLAEASLPGADQEIWSAAIFQFLGPACSLTRRLIFAGRVNLWPVAVASLLHPIISFEPTIFGNPSPRWLNTAGLNFYP